MEIIIIILGLIADRVSKILAVSKLKSGFEFVIIKNFFSFSYLENRGAAWGILGGKRIFLIIVTITVIILMVYYIIKKKPESKLMRISFSLIISGALGNLFDRVFKGYVVDFILFHYKDVYYFPTFNAADTMVVIGTALLILYVLRDDKNCRKNYAEK